MKLELVYVIKQIRNDYAKINYIDIIIKSKLQIFINV